MGFGVYCAVSAVVCGIMLGEALLVYPNLFSALVGLSDSVIKVCALINLACCLTILWTKFVLFLFLDGARLNEMQTVYNKGWLFLCNSMLYWSTRNLRTRITAYDLGVCMLSIFVLIALHWICSERVKVAFYESDPVSYFNIGRLGLLCTILLAIDICLCYKAVTDFLKRKYSLSLFGMFLLELLEMSTIFVGHYIINFVEMLYLMRNEDEDEWDSKVLLHTIVNLFSCITGIAAHSLILYVFNMNTSDSVRFAMRLGDLYHDGKELKRLLTSTSDVDKFSNPAEQADLERDNVCVICRDEMSFEHRGHQKKSPQRLHCGHVLHASCLKSWMVRSDKCPTCRQSVHTASSAFPAVERPAEPEAAPDAPGPLPGLGVEGMNRSSNDMAHAAPALQADAAAAAPMAPNDDDEDVSDLLSRAEPDARIGTTPQSEQLSISLGRVRETIENQTRIPSPTSRPLTFSVNRDSPISGTLISSGSAGQAYTFRESHLF